MKTEIPSPATLRLDKWLWFARLARTRSLAARLCAESRVSVGGRDGVKPHHAVRIGDVIVVELPHQRRRLIVRALGERRGPPAEAKLLYDEPTPPVMIENTSSGWVSLFEDDAVYES
jgi:ribosome-associated heat shock protein Hsp15